MATSKNTRPATGHIAPFGLRLQPELKARAEESAARHGRSLNAEIAHILQEYYDHQETPDTVGDESRKPKVFISYDSRTTGLLETLKEAIAENTEMRVLMNKQMELMSQISGQKLDKFVAGDLEYSTEEGVKNRSK